MSARLLRWVAGAAVAALVLTGCAGPTFSSLPLPGSGVSGSTIQVTADFEEALNLAHGAAVRVNGVDSGRVSDVTVHDFKARVVMKVRQDADLRRGATARLRYTTPLGELFVDVTNPASGPLIRDGDTLPLSATSTAPTVEDALASASLLINGGGLSQLQTITTEANKALGGHEGEIRDLINRSSYLLSQVNASTGDISRTLDALNRVSVMLHQRRQTIHDALVDVRPASRTLRANLGTITDLLQRLQRFGGTANAVVHATRNQIIELVREAGPTLQEMASVRSVFPQTLDAIIELAKIVDKVAPGDYLNLGTHLRLDAGVVNGKTLSSGTLLGLLGAKGGKSGGGGLLGGLGGLLGGRSSLDRLGAQVRTGVVKELLDGLTTQKQHKAAEQRLKPKASRDLVGSLLGGLLGGGR